MEGSATDLDRRQTGRFPASGAATLNWRNRWSLLRSAFVTVRNVSDMGVQVRLTGDAGMDEGQEVQLIGDDYDCRGRVVYFQEEGLTAVVGIEFVRPDHASSRAGVWPLTVH